MKKIIIFVLSLCSLPVLGQVKYKDLFLTFPGLSETEVKSALKEFWAQEPDHPNTNFRLAMLYKSAFQKADPLTEYVYALANAEQAKIRFLKAKQLVDQREVDRNNEYYQPFFKTLDSKGRPNVEYPLVASSIQNSYDSLELFLAKITPIYTSFTQSVNHYDQAVKIFAEISHDYASIEDIYLLHDQKLDGRLTRLKNNFDSTIINLNQYISLVKSYPIKDHRQQYKVNPIYTYRLDGLLTNINFLTNQIDLWDYSSWVDQVRKEVSTQVADLRKKIQANDQKLNESISKLNSGADVSPYLLDKQLIFSLNHLERQSLILAVLQYKSFKQGILIQSRQKADSANIQHQAVITSNLIHLNRKADTLILEAQNRYNPYRVSKHEQFINTAYKSSKGLEDYLTTESKEIKSAYQSYSSQLHQSLAKMDKAEDRFTNREMIIRIGKLTVPLNIQSPTPEGLENGTMFTLLNKKNSDGSTYLAGVYQPDKKIKNVVTFVARLNPDGKPAWVKDFNIPVDSTATSDANNYLGPLVLTQEGCALIVHSKQLTGLNQKNTFVYLNEKGDRKLFIRLPDKSYPRNLLYTEKTNSFVVLFKGMEETQDNTKVENISIATFNVLGDMLWRKEYALTGNVVDLVPVIDGHIIAGNFSIIKDLKGKETRTKVANHECSPYLIKISERGEMIYVNPIATPYSVYVNRVIKVSDNSINLIGYADNFSSAANRSTVMTDKFIHIMATLNTQVISTSY